MDRLRSSKPYGQQSWTSCTYLGERLRPALGVEAYDRRKRHVVRADCTSRRARRPLSTNFRPTSPLRISEQQRQRPRSRSPSVSSTSSPVPVSAELEQELERLIVKFRVRRTQKKQVGTAPPMHRSQRSLSQMKLFLELGLTLEELTKLLRRRAEVLDHRPSTIRKKVEFVIEQTNMSKTQFKKFFLKFPRILEYSMKKTVLPRLQFLRSIGCRREDLPKILIQAPAVTELSVENTLAPRVEFLRDVIGIRSELLRKTLLKKPQLLTYSQDSMIARIAFLQEWNMSATDIASVVARHPQILHYSVQSMSEHIRYLLHLGIERNNIQRVIARFPQILSLDLKVNVIPKVRYLWSELGGTTETLENNPVFVGLSLKKRIIPRHRFLSSLETVRVRRPVPVNWFKCSDAFFATHVAKVPLEQFIAFKEQCLQET